MSNFVHFTLAIEYNGGRITASQFRQIRDALLRNAETVAIPLAGISDKVKVKLVEPSDMPVSRDETGWHLHDNDGACTPCVDLYHHVHQETL